MFPKLISLGGHFLPSYGVLVAIGFLAGLWVATRLAKEQGLPAEVVSNLAVYCALAGLAGGKLFMFLFDFNEYWEHPGRIFSLETLQAAGVYQGGFLVALIVGVLYLHYNLLPIGKTFDVFAPGIAIGHAIGRLGCLAAGCCWGKPTHLPWAITFTNQDAHELTDVPLNVPVHPTQLYESALNLIIFWFLWRRIHKPHRSGEIFGWYLVFYSTARFLVEFLRNHEQALLLGLSLTQWISLGTLLLGLWILRPRKPVASEA
jgi:phosphatidylglycerol:prolipoprotein diacylglycerol transferase